jgi:hypothetical protein
LVISKEREITNLDIRIKNGEIIFSSLLCYFTIKTNLYKHHIVSLIIITLNLLLIFCLELYIQIKKKIYLNKVFLYLLVHITINLCRVFPDIIEYFLIEINHVNPFKILAIKNAIEIFLISFFYIFDRTRNEIAYLFNLNIKNIIICVFLLVFYFILSGITNIYKIFTIIQYSPMTRALFDNILGIFYFIYDSIKEDSKEKKINTYYFWINIVLQLIIVFFNLIYNEFLVLYICNMNINTYIEISKRGKEIEFVEEEHDLNLSFDDYYTRSIY